MNLNDKSKQELISKIESLESRISLTEKDRVGVINSTSQIKENLDQGEFIAIGLNSDGTITYINQQLQNIIGEESILHQSIFEVFEFKHSKVIHDVIQNKSFNRAFTIAYDINVSQPLRIRVKSFIEDGPEVILIGDDVSNLKSESRLLKKTNQQFQDLFNKAHDLIQIFSYDGKILYVNNYWKKKLGYTKKELETLNLKELIAPEYYETTKQKLFNISNGELKNHLVTTFLTKSGKKVNVSGNIYCNYEGNKVTEFRGIFHDITEQIRAEKAQNLYYSIANLAAHSSDLENLFKNIHNELQKVIDAKNFYIALIDGESNMVKFPYIIDDYSKISYTERPFENGITEYAIIKKTPLFLYEEDMINLGQKENITINGKIPKIWIGVPLILENRTIGVIAVQSYDNKNCYNLNDVELLDFISGQVAISIERKKNEEKINAQNARINAIFENGSHLVWSVNRDLIFTSYNQNFAKLFNHLFKTSPENYSKDPTVLDIPYGEIWETNYKKAFDGIPVNFEVKFDDEQGKEIWREVFLNPIVDPDGNINEVSGIAHDITEKKYSELALLESEEKFRTIFESFQDIYFRCKLDGEITVVSPSVEELVGYSPNTVLNRNITNYYLYSSKTKHLIRTLIKKKAVRNFEASLVKKNGNIINCICNVRFVYDKNNKATQIEGVARDITNLKKANLELVKAKEVAERSVKVKDLFLANMSHEIRTPMNGIIGMIDLISGTKLNNEQKNYIQTIKRSSETLLNILNDILDLSKIEAGKMQLKKHPVRLKTVMEKLYALFSQQALSKNTNLYYHIDKKLPEYIIVDETRLLQILSNLTSNAIKFTDGDGSIDIGVKRPSNKDGSNMIKVDVTDSGIGISEENLNKLFYTFNQLDNSTTKTYSGTGLGLSISKELCKLMNGDIGVSSTEGLGSTFWFTFEAEEADPNMVLESEAYDKNIDLQSYFKSKKPYILLVDDNLVNRQVAGEILKKSGCKVDLAVNGFKAIEKAKAKNYDCILMDIQMPDMDGVVATQKIRNIRKDKTPPVIAMTAYSMKEDRERFIKQGLDDYIAKPIRANELIKKVQSWVSYEAKTLQKQDPTYEQKEKVINEDVISQLRKYGGDEMVKKVFADFENETKEQLELCIVSLKNKNFENIRSHLHTLKGNAGTLGIEKVAKYAEYIEANLKKNNLETLEQDLNFLKLTFSEFQNSYVKILE